MMVPSLWRRHQIDCISIRTHEMIDHYKLIDILADRLKIEIKTAGNDLLEVLEQLNRSLKEVGEAELTGLGKFYFNGNQVTFEPDPTLEMDINFRYHGLQPIVVEEAKHEALHTDGDENEIPETAVFVINELEAPAVAIDADELVDTDSPATPDAEELEAISVSPINMAASKVSDLKTPPLKWRDPHTVPLEIRIDGNYVHKGERWRKLVGTVAFASILLAGAGVSWYKGWLSGTGIQSFHETFPEYVTRNDPGSITLESPTIDQNRDARIEQGQLQEQEQEQGQRQEQGQGLEQGLGLEVQQPDMENVVTGTYGLSGSWQQDTPSFFTIVSATMFTQRVANEIFDEVVASNIRARLFRVRVQGEIAWELHLGQFETREAAREANLTMDRKFQSDVVRQYGQQ